MIARSVACALLAVVFLAGASCSPGDDDTDGTTSSSSSSSSSSTTLSTEDALRRQVVDLFELRNEIFMNPNPDRLGELIDSRCPCFAEDERALSELKAKSWRYEAAHIKVVGVRLENDDLDGLARFTVAMRAEPVAVVDEGGNEVDEISGLELSAFQIGLTRIDGVWKLGTLSALELNPEALNDLVEVGTP